MATEPRVPPSREVRDEDFWRRGGNFRWCWPKFDRFNPADKRTRWLLNRYPHNIIGAALVVFGHGFGIRWKSSRRGGG